VLAKIAAYINLAVAQIQSTAMLPVWSLAFAPLLCLADLHRRKETVLLANLGLRIPYVVMIATIPAVLFEILLAIVLPIALPIALR
jgi:hypothetical protein